MSTFLSLAADRRWSVGNRRRGGRHLLDVPATLCGVDGDAFSVRLSELSVAGVGLFSERAPVPGSTYELAAFDSLVPVGMRVRVVWTRAAETGGYIVGAEVV